MKGYTTLNEFIYCCRKASLHEKVFCVEILIVGIIGGVVATYSALEALANPDTLVPPCYVNLNITN